MISAGDFRNGVTFEQDGELLQVVEFQHVKPGKGAAFVRTKTRNINTGAVTETTYNPNDKFPIARIERRDMQYLYKDGGLYYFMDTESYEQMPINESDLGDGFEFIKENETVQVLSHNEDIIGVEPPNFVVLEVTQTEPGVRGDTATSTLKEAVVETGAEVRVPLFVNIGDKIRVDTRSGEYVERA